MYEISKVETGEDEGAAAVPATMEGDGNTNTNPSRGAGAGTIHWTDSDNMPQGGWQGGRGWQLGYGWPRQNKSDGTIFGAPPFYIEVSVPLCVEVSVPLCCILQCCAFTPSRQIIHFPLFLFFYYEYFEFAQNIFEELDAPSEWYFDKKTKLLYLWHNSTSNEPPPTDLTFVATQLSEMIGIHGELEGLHESSVYC
jgi:hypothetical protein